MSRFGYERHTDVNQDGLIIAEDTTPANESDMKHLETLWKRRVWQTARL